MWWVVVQMYGKCAFRMSLMFCREVSTWEFVQHSASGDANAGLFCKRIHRSFCQVLLTVQERWWGRSCPLFKL